MQAKELMIGDWVKMYNGKGEYLDNTQVNMVMLDLLEQEQAVMRLEPLPLTDAILKANGFRREGGASYWHEGDRDASILYWNKDRTELIVGSPCDECMVKINVRYVHELQHAFRLAGIDKEIKLKED